MTSGGWIKLHRSLKDEWFYTKPDYLLVWIHLLLSATWEEGKEILFRNEPYRLKIGELVTGRKKLATELKLSESKIERILARFVKDGRIEMKTDFKCRVIKLNQKCFESVSNPDTLQALSNNGFIGVDEQVPDRCRTGVGQVSDTYKEYKNIRSKEDKKINTANNKLNISSENAKNGTHAERVLRTMPTEKFEEFWKSLPSEMKIGKKLAFKRFKATVKTDADFADLCRARDKYLKSKRVQRGFIQNGSTWMNNWQDWLQYDEKEHYRKVIEKTPAGFILYDDGSYFDPNDGKIHDKKGRVVNEQLN